MNLAQHAKPRLGWRMLVRNSRRKAGEGGSPNDGRRNKWVDVAGPNEERTTGAVGGTRNGTLIADLQSCIAESVDKGSVYEMRALSESSVECEGGLEAAW